MDPEDDEEEDDDDPDDPPEEEEDGAVGGWLSPPHPETNSATAAPKVTMQI
jgi:hypothetical protein